MSLDREYLRKLYKKLGCESLKQSTIHGLHIFTYETKLKKGRTFWFIFLLVLFIWTHYVIINLTINHLRQPTEIHMSPVMIHVSNSPFPGVAICSANKFSKRKIEAFADQLFEVQQRSHPDLLAKTSAEMAQQLLLLAGFYVFPYDNYDVRDKRLEHLHTLLTSFFDTDEYPSRDLLRYLAPDCESLVVRAHIFGKEISPMDLFLTHTISTGVCCMFNYKRPSYSENSTFFKQPDGNEIREVKFEANTMLNSVQFVLQSDVEDFTYREFSNDAFRLFIFPPMEYAPTESKISDFLVDYNSIVDIPIQPKFFDADDSIKEFPPSTRNCYFPKEGQRILNQSYYSFDECLLVCRMHSMIRHCGCVNPSLPAVLVNARYCTPLDFPCLTQWKSSWYMWYAPDIAYDNIDDAALTAAITKDCNFCMPSCDGVTYDIFVNELPLRKTVGTHYGTGILKGLTNEKPLAIVRLFFRQAFAQVNVDVIVSDWVVLLNRFGGIMSFMYGFGLVSIIEFVYFASAKFFSLFAKPPPTNWNQPVNVDEAGDEIHTPRSYKLYWRELVPKTSKQTMMAK